MARQVKCQDTGEKSTSDKAYKAPNGKYYSSKEAYQEIFIQKEARNECIAYLYELLDYDDIPAPTVLYKLLDEMKKCGYDVILTTLEQCEDKIKWALDHKEFNNEYNRIKYLMAIVRNNVVDVYKVKQDQKKAAIIDIKNYQHQTNDYNIGGTSGKGRDVTKFLGDME